ncbi:MAG: hypothetical protein M1812_002533 [Candelaria pacifica]|nr:MAG: hypothetical protein M1812_002533 [Candelaria pacifica]
MSSSTSTPTASDESVEYVIYPLDGTDVAQTDSIYELLQSFVESDSIYTSKSQYLGVNFWKAIISAEDAEILKSNKDVASVSPSRTGDDVYDPLT